MSDRKNDATSSKNDLSFNSLLSEVCCELRKKICYDDYNLSMYALFSLSIRDK